MMVNNKMDVYRIDIMHPLLYLGTTNIRVYLLGIFFLGEIDDNIYLDCFFSTPTRNKLGGDTDTAAMHQLSVSDTWLISVLIL